jgi:hypothetical protein
MNGYRKALFPIHIYQANIRQNESLKEVLLPKIEKCYKENRLPVPSGWNTDKIYTTFDRDKLNEEVFKDTKTQSIYVDYIKKFFDDEFKIMIHETWFNYYVDGEYQESHDHLSANIFAAPSHFSCIHYLSFDKERHEPVIFTDPIEKIRYASLNLKSNNYNSVYTPEIKEGDFLMFPSYLDHYVKPSQPTPDYPRITISLNFAVINYGDEGMNFLEEENGNQLRG